MDNKGFLHGPHYIIGAGFSCGVNPDKIPVTSNFFDIASQKDVYKPTEDHKRLGELVILKPRKFLPLELPGFI